MCAVRGGRRGWHGRDAILGRGGRRQRERRRAARGTRAARAARAAHEAKNLQTVVKKQNQ